MTGDKKIRPENFDTLKNTLELSLINESYSFESGITSYETLGGNSSDKYQYILPYYSYDKTISKNYFKGTLNFLSNGSNDLSSTNKLDTSIINELNYDSQEYFSDKGFKTNYKINMKNTNVIEKKAQSTTQVLNQN